MKVAVIGASGQLGSDLVEVFGDEAIPFTHSDVEVKDSSSCYRALKKHSPNAVINCAAYVKVDDAEDEAEEAFAVNAVGAKNVAEACEKIGAVNVYISTDYVFDGTKEEPYTEDDIPNPVNTYGLSKLAGEIFTRNYSSSYYIARVSSLYGKKGARGKGGNFVETMIKKARNKEKIKVIDDITITPTYTKNAADMIKNILDKNLPTGIYHCSNSGHCTWYDFTEAIFNIEGSHPDLNRTKTRDFPMRARRPENSSLKNENLKKHGVVMPHWRKGLNEYLKETKEL